MSFQAEFENEEVKGFIDGIAKNVKNVSLYHKKYITLISAVVYRDVIDHFSKERGSQGPWQLWSKKYAELRLGAFKEKKMSAFNRIGKAKTGAAKKKAREKYNSIGTPKILQLTGKLRQNFAPTNWKSSLKGVYWYNNAKTKGGFGYAQAHDEGAGKLPKRDFMWLSEKALTDITNNTLGFLIEEGKK